MIHLSKFLSAIGLLQKPAAGLERAQNQQLIKSNFPLQFAAPLLDGACSLRVGPPVILFVAANFTSLF